MNARILIVDDEELIRWSLAEDLGTAGYKTYTAENVSEALSKINQENPDLILTDLKMNGETGIDLIKRLQETHPALPVILMTGFADVDTAVEAMRAGASDFISKPLQLGGLKITIKRVLETASLKSRLGEAHKKRRRKFNFDTLIHASPSMKEAVDTARKIAATPYGTVLILGESGVGKDRMARAIHYESTRASEPFMEISCTAIPDHLLESELFGNEKGAYTGATERKKGLFETAAGGTVFLNEIGHMPMSLQAKMLRVLEDKTFKRVGGREDITVDVRIIAATNENLEKAILEEKFREDLYYRINVLAIRLQPLRERQEDILPLADLLLDSLARDLRKPKIVLKEKTKSDILAYSWPGNVRELKNVLERMMILNEENFSPQRPPRLETPPPTSVSGPDTIIPLDDMEKDMIQKALQKTNDNQQQAARMLGISRDALRRRIEKFGLKGAAGALLVLLTSGVFAHAGWFSIGNNKGRAEETLDLFYEAHKEKAAEFAKRPHPHQPITENKCSVCHADPAKPETLTMEFKPLCLSCHEYRSKDLLKEHVHPPFKEGDCSTCHDPHGSDEERMLTAGQDTLCTMCHGTEDDPLKSSHFGITAIKSKCTSCHSPHGSTNKKLIIEQPLHAPFKMSACSMCHQATGEEGNAVVKDPISEACFMCHGDTKKLNDKENVHVPFMAGECAMCHYPHVSKHKPLLKEPAQDLCRTCHDDIPIKGHPAVDHPTAKEGVANPLRKDRPFDCASCHNPHASDEEKFKRPEAKCSGCHKI